MWKWIYCANRDRPLGEVLGENELNDIDRYPWLAGHRLADVITASFGHFHEEHEPVLRDWLARLG